VIDSLREIHAVRQVAGEGLRRWFTSETMDLLVWFDEDDMPIRLQLGYGKGRHRDERIFSWRKGVGYDHLVVGNGEHDKRYKATPLMMSDAAFNGAHVGNLFREYSINVPLWIVDFVLEKIAAYGAGAPKDEIDPLVGARRKIIYW